MLKSLLDRLAALLDPDGDLHAGDDSHALDEEYDDYDEDVAR
jgi:hypothetical protein